MNNKLLIGTALSSVIALSGSAFAELKVSGDVEATHRGISYDKADQEQNGNNGLGIETNVALSYSKDLDNGLSLNAGSTIEDGTADSEFITIGGGVVSFTVGQDVGNNLSSTVVPHISDQTGTLVAQGTVDGDASGDKIGYAALYDNQFAANDEAHSATHVSLDAKAAGGTFTVRYAPNNIEAARPSDSGVRSDTGKGSATEILYKGSLGVEGLGVQLGRQTETQGEESVANVDDPTLDKLGISYNFGQFAVGAQTQRFDDGTASDSDTDTKTYAVTFAASDQLSLGLRYHETDKDGSAYTADEEITVLEVGYNFGGLGVELAYADIENIGGKSAQGDAEVLQIRTRAKF